MDDAKIGDTAGAERLRSYRDLDPLEQGGPFARRGYLFQDHVAASKCIDMLLGVGASEVWCEAEDDVVLVWHLDGVEVFEFVQVKSDDLKQAWSLAKLCERVASKDASKDGKGPGRCIVEKSLGHDRGPEPCCFRIVTCWNPNDDLAVLTLERDAARSERLDEVGKVASVLREKLGSCLSPNGNGVEFWSFLTVWETHAHSDALRNASLLKLERVLEQTNLFLAPDQRVELYEKLLARIQVASATDGRTDRLAKRFCRLDLRAWIVDAAQSIRRPVQAGTSAPLVAKLTAAGLDATSVESAKEQRWRYRSARLESKYLSVDEHDEVEGDIHARLHLLKARLDAHEIADDGPTFHNRCLTEVVSLRDSLPPDRRPPVAYIIGCVYDVMNRCLHRLVRATP